MQYSPLLSFLARPEGRPIRLIRREKGGVPARHRLGKLNYFGRLAALGLTTFSLGCAATAEPEESGDQSSATHAIVRIQQTTDLAGGSRGDALAGFVQVPSGTDLSQILQVAGLSLQVPKKGDCWKSPEPIPPADLLATEHVELVEADSVELLTEGGSQHLAPYAFPTVADLLRGVVYLSRDRASQFPAGTSYAVVGRGIEATGDAPLDMSGRYESPPFIDNLALNGKDAAPEMQVSPGEVLDLSWQRSGATSDLLVVSLESDATSWVCSFADSDEFGSVPLLTEDGISLGGEGQKAHLSVHRIRTTRTEIPENGLADAFVTFDFALETQVTFKRASE